MPALWHGKSSAPITRCGTRRRKSREALLLGNRTTAPLCSGIWKQEVWPSREMADTNWAATCELPEITSIVSSLAVRHPTMIAEAASLARIDEIFGDLIADPHGAPAQLSSSTGDISVLGQANTPSKGCGIRQSQAAIKACDQRRLLRVLVLGGDHIATARTSPSASRILN